MKKLFFIAMIIASVGAKAQTPTLCNGIIPILMGDSVIFDLPEHPFDITLHLNKKNGYGIYCFEYDIDNDLKSGALYYLYSQMKYSYTNYSNPDYFFNSILNTQFPMQLGNSYSITYSLPTPSPSLYPFHFKYYYNYYLNYNSILIKICAISSNGEIMGTFNVAEIPISVSMVQAQDYYQTFLYWDCYGLGNSDTNVTYYYDGLFTAHRIQPTVDFMDLWYTEYDQVPRDPEWKEHSAFVAEIDHFAIGLGFGN